MVAVTFKFQDMKEWMSYLCSDELRGRLTGDIGYTKAANYAADLFKSWGLEPDGIDAKTLHMCRNFQNFRREKTYRNTLLSNNHAKEKCLFPPIYLMMDGILFGEIIVPV